MIVEVFNANVTANSKKNYKIIGEKIRVYDEYIQSYFYSLDKSSSKIIAPKSEKSSLNITTSLISLQLLLSNEKPFSFEIVVSDQSKFRKKLFFSTSIKQLLKNSLNVRIPINFLERDRWIHMNINVQSILNNCFLGSYFTCIDSITLFPFCFVRTIFGNSTEKFELDSLNNKYSFHYNFPENIEILVYYIDYSSLINNLQNDDKIKIVAESIFKKSSIMPIYNNNKMNIGKKVNDNINFEKLNTICEFKNSFSNNRSTATAILEFAKESNYDKKEYIDEKLEKPFVKIPNNIKNDKGNLKNTNRKALKNRNIYNIEDKYFEEKEEIM